MIPVMSRRRRRQYPKEAFRAGQAGRCQCPGCGEPIIFARYVKDPSRRRPGDLGRLMAFEDRPRDAPPAPPEYGRYAAQGPGYLTCRYLHDDHAELMDGEVRVRPHVANHPACETYLTRSHR